MIPRGGVAERGSRCLGVSGADAPFRDPSDEPATDRPREKGLLARRPEQGERLVWARAGEAAEPGEGEPSAHREEAMGSKRRRTLHRRVLGSQGEAPRFSSQ